MTKSPIVGYIRRGFKLRQKVFGLGFMKTGTTTLGQCFKYYGLQHESRRPDLWMQYAAGDIGPLLEETERFDSFEDMPWPLAYRELYTKYGNQARYILTTRSSSEKWIESFKKQTLRGTNKGTHPRKTLFGFDYPHGVEDHYISIYEEHNAAVRNFFSDKSDVFLDICWERGHGWAELSAFLGYRTPNTALPHANASADRTIDPLIEAENKRRIAAQFSSITAERPPSSQPQYPNAS